MLKCFNRTQNPILQSMQLITMLLLKQNTYVDLNRVHLYDVL